MPPNISGNVSAPINTGAGRTQGNKPAKQEWRPKQTQAHAQLSANTNKSEASDNVARPRTQLPGTAPMPTRPAPIAVNVEANAQAAAPSGGPGKPDKADKADKSDKSDASKGGKELGSSGDAMKSAIDMSKKSTEGAESSGDKLMASMKEMNDLNMKFQHTTAQLQLGTKMTESVAKSIKNVGEAPGKIMG